MPANLKDFVDKAGSTSASGVSVNKVLKAQQEGQDETNEKLTDIAQMFVRTQEKVAADQDMYDKDTVKALISIDKNFETYFNNLSDMSVMLNKFVDPNYKMNKKEAGQLQALIAQDKALVNGIDQMKSQDAGFNAKLEKLQSENNFLFRNKGVMDDEERRLAKKNNESTKELWSSINDNIGTLSTDVMSDLKTSLIEGIGGPYASMMRKVMIPMFKQIKDSKLGKIVGDKFKNLGGFLRKSYKKQADLDKELSGEETDAVVEGLDEVVDESKIEKKQQTQKGVFKKLLDEQIKTNEGLAAFSDSLHSELSALNGVFDVIVKGGLVSSDLEGKSPEEIGNIISSATSVDEYLSEILTAQNVNNEHEKLSNEMFEKLLETSSTEVEGEEEYKDAQTEFQMLLMEKLEDIEDSLRKVEGDEGGFIGDALGLGIASSLGPLVKALGPIAIGLAGVSAGLIFLKKSTDASLEKDTELTEAVFGGTDENMIQKFATRQRLAGFIRRGGGGEFDEQNVSGGIFDPEVVKEFRQRQKEGDPLLDPSSPEFKEAEREFQSLSSGKRVSLLQEDPVKFFAAAGMIDKLSKASQEVVKSAGESMTGAIDDTVKEISSDVVNDKIDQMLSDTVKEQDKVDIMLAGNKGGGSKSAAKTPPASIGVNQGSLKGSDQRKRLDEVGIYPDDNMGLILINQGGAINRSNN